MLIELLDANGDIKELVRGTVEWASSNLTPGTWRVVEDQSTAQRPEIVVTELAVDEPYDQIAIIEADLHSVTLPVGATLTITAEIRANNQLVPYTGKFRMPLVSLDNRIRVLLVEFVDGVAVFSAKMTDSRIYHVRQEHVNQSLPPEEHMDFRGFWVYAIE